ncbi:MULTISPECIES: hypothetical protein [unclassified Bradyrhizobium]|uniref:hypothetical protein n=1 Tax=unclassified Bradyrhizobium TaxID=2631580 RepID=UPI0028EBB985|nr:MULTISPECIES: hypothetical protein [unclassified Bradyrhizobium]
MTQTLKDLLALAGGGAVVIAAIAGFSYWIFKVFSEKWLTAKFTERLEDYKHKQQRELEELRFKINALMDRTTKLHQREFDVLPEAWGKLVIAHGNVQGVVAALQQHPDVDRMSPEQQSEFIEKSALRDWQKQELRKAPNKTEYYQSASRWVRFWEVRDLYRDYFIYQRKNGIFIRSEIKSGFRAVSDLIHGALVEFEVELQYGSDLRQWDARTKFSKESDDLMDALETAVQKRLWDSQTIEPAARRAG